MAKTETIDRDTGEITNSNMTDDTAGVPMVAEASVVTQLARVEIDTAIATARAYPRSIDLARREITAMIPNEDAAEECIYALPRGGKHIRGPSIRFAEIVVASWGNCESGARVTHIGDEFVEAEGVYRDYQKNVRKVRRVRRRILDRYGKRYNEDMILMTCNAACSIAERNAILAGVPKAVWNDAYAQVHALIGGAVGSIDTKRERALSAFAKLGIEAEKVFAVLEVKGASDITPDHIIDLRGMLNALRTGEETVQSMFSPQAMAGKHFDSVKSPLKDDAPKDNANAGAGADQRAADAERETKQEANDQKAAADAARAAEAEKTKQPDVQQASSQDTAKPQSSQEGPRDPADYIENVAKPFLASASSISKIDDWKRRDRQTRINLKFGADDMQVLEDMIDARKDELTKKS